jgi:hypothetical protein
MKYIFLSFLLLSACAPWRGPLPLRAAGGEAAEGVLAMDEAAWQLVSLQGYRLERADGRLGVEAELVNLSSLDLNIQVRTVFRDKEGVLVDQGGIWEMLVLPGSGSRLYRAASLSERAVSAQVEIKTP